ncbi:MAG TPA: DNA polymerase III subunit beta [Thermodesulfovibrionales bacterium]|nr:DNA polymerase III subunit beta [Thermodesulfovibrionales bacterium]
MRLNVSKDEMQEKLSNIQNIVEKKNTMPILSHFLLDAGKKGSYIVATDLETALKEPVEIKVEEEGKVCIPARKLFEIVREMDGELLLESVDESPPGGGWLKVKAGKSEFRLACLPANDFPVWPAMEDVEEVTVDATVLMEMIERTIYSAGESDTRYTLNGLLFHTQPNNKALTIVGTDGHRLALITKQMEGKGKDEKKIIVPRKAVSELRRFLNRESEKTKILIGKNHLLFSLGFSAAGGEVQFLTRLIEGTYPSYENVIPQGNEKKVSVSKEAFTKALRRVSVMSRERANAVRFDFGESASGGSLVISSSNPDLGEAKEEVAVDYKGDNLSVGFNARYLIEAMGAMMAERVILELQDPLSPVLVKEEGREDYRCVVMPMRI